jgi:hypothetical protein
MFVNKCDCCCQETGVPQSILFTNYCQSNHIKEDGVEETSTAYRILFGESEETISVTLEDNIKLDLKEKEYGSWKEFMSDLRFSQLWL